MSGRSPFFQGERNDLLGISIRISSGGRLGSGDIAAPHLWTVCWKPSARLCYELCKIPLTVFFRLSKKGDLPEIYDNHDS
jgi:hypothetical protein